LVLAGDVSFFDNDLDGAAEDALDVDSEAGRPWSGSASRSDLSMAEPNGAAVERPAALSRLAAAQQRDDHLGSNPSQFGAATYTLTVKPRRATDRMTSQASRVSPSARRAACSATSPAAVHAAEFVACNTARP
jgi:hypothetical protein